MGQGVVLGLELGVQTARRALENESSWSAPLLGLHPCWGSFHLYPFAYICTTKRGPTVTLHPVAMKGSVGAGGRDGPGGREPSPFQLPPRGCGGGSVAHFQPPPLCPSLWLSQKELSVLLQHSRPGEGDSWLGGHGGGPCFLSFFLAWAARWPQISAGSWLQSLRSLPGQEGEGAACPKLCVPALGRAGWARRGRDVVGSSKVGCGASCPKRVGWRFGSNFHNLYCTLECTEILWVQPQPQPQLPPSLSYPPPSVCPGPIPAPEALEGHLEACLA